MKSSLLLYLVVGTMASANDLAVEECLGCHTVRRNEPQSRFATGLGQWKDRQCYGCHAELNEVALQSVNGIRDRRYFAVPVSEDKLMRFAMSPLAYMNAPETMEPREGDVRRISWERLKDFLRRPASLSPVQGSRAPRMMAYPSLSSKDLKAAATVLDVKQPAQKEPPARMTEADRRQADALWKSRCVPCHGGARPLSGRSGVALGLYTSQWLHAYAGGSVSSPRKERAMPIVPLSSQEAELLYQLFGEMRSVAERELDERVSRIRIEHAAAPVAVPRALVGYLWGPFFREATCIHCHATNSRAAGAFIATAEGLKAYLKRKSGTEFWRRLEIRALEADQGLVAAQPGMPMAGVELPKELRAFIARWVMDGCRDLEGKSWCHR